jgi:hypothetical protein
VQRCHEGKGWLLWRIYNIKHFFRYNTISCVLFHSFDVLKIVKIKKPWMSRCFQTFDCILFVCPKVDRSEEDGQRDKVDRSEEDGWRDLEVLM